MLCASFGVFQVVLQMSCTQSQAYSIAKRLTPRLFVTSLDPSTGQHVASLYVGLSQNKVPKAPRGK